MRLVALQDLTLAVPFTVGRSGVVDVIGIRPLPLLASASNHSK